MDNMISEIMSFNITPVASGYQEIHPYSALLLASIWCLVFDIWHLVFWYLAFGILVFGIWHLVFWYFSLDKLCQALSGCRTLPSSAKLGLKSAGEPCQRHRPRMQSLDAPTPTRQLTELNSSGIFHLYEAIDCTLTNPKSLRTDNFVNFENRKL